MDSKKVRDVGLILLAALQHEQDMAVAASMQNEPTVADLIWEAYTATTEAMSKLDRAVMVLEGIEVDE